ncbi:hypothetical protein G6F65_022124 [Rhizopus arrhizus]|nr:hypothetical protein G6F65_022124 [Rhizopus arrhizus]
MGAVVYQAGSWLCVAWPWMRASTGQPSRRATDSRVSTRAAAPSALADALAAVMVPSSRKAGLRVEIFSGDTFNGFSSWSTISAPPLPGTATGAISAANAPDSTACRARRSVSAA